MCLAGYPLKYQSSSHWYSWLNRGKKKPLEQQGTMRARTHCCLSVFVFFGCVHVCVKTLELHLLLSHLWQQTSSKTECAWIFNIDPFFPKDPFLFWRWGTELLCEICQDVQLMSDVVTSDHSLATARPFSFTHVVTKPDFFTMRGHYRTTVNFTWIDAPLYYI